MRHGCSWRRAMPVLHARRNPDYVALANLLNRPSPLLNPPCAVRDNQDLAERVRMPGAPRFGLKRHPPAACARGIVSDKELLNLHRTSEILGRPFVCLQGLASRDADRLRILSWCGLRSARRRLAGGAV